MIILNKVNISFDWFFKDRICLGVDIYKDLILISLFCVEIAIDWGEYFDKQWQ